MWLALRWQLFYKHALLYKLALLYSTALLGAAACGSEAPLPPPPARAEPTPGADDDATADTDAFDERLLAVSAMYDRLLEIAQERAAFMCACEVASEDLIAECVRETTTIPPPPIVECTKTILSQDERALIPLECELENYEAYLACITESTCRDFEHILDCDVERLLRAEECTSLPWDVWATNKEQCEGIPQPAPFECDNGELINPQWVCDLEPDCSDGSDELGCGH